MDINGEKMMILTDVLRNQRTKVGRIAGNLTLPRPVELRTLLAVGVGSFIGLLLALIVNPGNTQSMFYGATIGGCAGWGATNWSPLKGETLATWILLTLRTKGGRVISSTNQEKLAIGICYLPETARGSVQVTRGAIQVSEGSVDSRGIFKKVNELTLPTELRNQMREFTNTIPESSTNKNIRLSTNVKNKKSAQSKKSNVGKISRAREEAGRKPAPWREDGEENV